MTKLSTIDAGFIYAESDNCPMSIASLQFMQLPSGVSSQTFVSTLRSFIAERSHLVPYLTSKLQWSSGIWDHPNWVTDEKFDINNHIYAIQAPEPADRQQVEHIVARLHAQPLDRNRPLWDIAVITGLANNQVAYYNRVHHACLDGVAAQASFEVLMDRHPDAPGTKTAIPGGTRKSISIQEHVAGLFEAMTMQAIDNITLTPNRITAASRLWRRSLDANKGLGAAAMPRPNTRFNKAITGQRAWAAGELPLIGVKQIARALKCTVNDVFLATCGGALRTYLQRHHELPVNSLIAGCPVSTRRGPVRSREQASSNQVSMMNVALGTHIEDARDRVLYVHKSAYTGKAVCMEATAIAPADLNLPFMGVAVHSGQFMAKHDAMTNPSIPLMNVVISNVPGPRQPLYSNGAKMLSHYPVSIPAHGAGLNITVQSYVDTLYIGITAAANVASDVSALRDDIANAYKALHNSISAPIVHIDDPQTVKNEKKPAVKTPGKTGTMDISGKVA